jgi:hypothetical protein
MSEETARDDSAPTEELLSPPIAIPLRGSFHRSAAVDLVERAAHTLLGYAAAAVVLLLLLAPPVAILIMGLWSSLAYVAALRMLYLHVVRYDLTASLSSLGALADAAGVGVLSAAYFALLFSTMVLMAGLLGSGWWRTSLAPGLVLTVFSGLAFGLGAHLTAAGAGARLGIAPGVEAALTLYALFDALVLSAVLVDMRPPSRHAHRRRWARSRARVDTPPIASTVIPIAVRFGPTTHGEPSLAVHIQAADTSQAQAAEDTTGEQPPAEASSITLPTQVDPLTYPHTSADTASVA